MWFSGAGPRRSETLSRHCEIPLELNPMHGHNFAAAHPTPTLITRQDDVEFLVNNFLTSKTHPFPEPALAFAPLLYLDPVNLPSEVTEYWSLRCDDLVRILTASEEETTKNRLLDNYLPVAATDAELLYWIGQRRIAHGIYYGEPEEIINGYDHQVESLTETGNTEEARAVIQRIADLQTGLGHEIVDTDYLLKQLDSHKEENNEKLPGATNAFVDGLTYIESAFSLVDFDPTLCLTSISVDFEAISANLSAATPFDVESWIPWLSKVAANELAIADAAGLKLLIQLDKVIIESLFVHNSSAPAVSFDKALQPWYELFYASPPELLTALSPRTTYYALSIFAKVISESPRSHHDIEARLDLLNSVAAELGDYKTALEAINKKTRHAQNYKDYAAAMASAREAYIYGEELLEQKQTTAIPEVLWATRSLAQLLSWAGQKAEAADLLLAIPKRFSFVDLSFNAQVNYIFSRIELAQLFHEAKQERGRRILLQEAANLYESINLHSEALTLRRTHKL